MNARSGFGLISLLLMLLAGGASLLCGEEIGAGGVTVVPAEVVMVDGVDQKVMGSAAVLWSKVDGQGKRTSIRVTVDATNSLGVQEGKEQFYFQLFFPVQDLMTEPASFLNEEMLVKASYVVSKGDVIVLPTGYRYLVESLMVDEQDGRKRVRAKLVLQKEQVKPNEGSVYLPFARGGGIYGLEFRFSQEMVRKPFADGEKVVPYCEIDPPSVRLTSGESYGGSSFRCELMQGDLLPCYDVGIRVKAFRGAEGVESGFVEIDPNPLALKTMLPRVER